MRMATIFHKIIGYLNSKHKGNGRSTDTVPNKERMADLFHEFLCSLDERDRNVFLCRYWCFDPIEGIAKYFSTSPQKIKEILSYSCACLRECLEKKKISLKIDQIVDLIGTEQSEFIDDVAKIHAIGKFSKI